MYIANVEFNQTDITMIQSHGNRISVDSWDDQKVYIAYRARITI